MMYMKVLASKFLERLGALLLLWEVLQLIITELAESSCCKIIIGVIILVISLSWSIVAVYCKKKEITLEINKRTKITIGKRDLMLTEGVRVIPVNEYFDTHNGDGIINPKSLHGELISIFSDDLDDLKRQIRNGLKNVMPLKSERVRDMVPDLPQDRYPLGTCVRVRKDNQYYILVAITRFDANEHVDVSTEEYPEVVRKMINGIEGLNNGEPVNLSLVGSGISGYQLTNMQLLTSVIQAASNANKLAVTKGMYLCIMDDEQLNTLNLNIIKYWFNNWINLR